MLGNWTLRLAFFAITLTGATTMAYESIYPRTPVGTLEFKTLPARTTLIASAPGDAFKDRGAAFRQLFAYIKENKVAMSVPIEASASTNEMLFLVGGERAPLALTSGKGVAVRTLPAGTVASLGLRGGYTRENYEKGVARLKTWLEAQPEKQACGEPYVVYWNSPFMPAFLRKAEIHIPVRDIAAAAGLPAFYTFTVETLDGVRTNLAPYQGQVVLVVNVASRCGFTKQYEGLQKLYETCRARGFTILGFPCNDFMGQEPGTPAEIQQFCTVKFGVTFPLFGKVHVKGAEKHPLFAWLTDETRHPGLGGEVSWNFNKFLVGRDGRLLARFESRTTPDDPGLIAAIEQALEPPL